MPTRWSLAQINPPLLLHVLYFIRDLEASHGAVDTVEHGSHRCLWPVGFAKGTIHQLLVLLLTLLIVALPTGSLPRVTSLLQALKQTSSRILLLSRDLSGRVLQSQVRVRLAERGL